jgi:hypothetical protein
MLKRCCPSLIDWANQFSRNGRKRRLAAAAAAKATAATGTAATAAPPRMEHSEKHAA